MIDLPQIFFQVIAQVWYLLPILLLITVCKSSWFKGVFGEFVVNFLISTKLDKDRYHLIKNVTLPTVDGSTQVDHVLVSKYGVFVIETKNMKGWIFGSANQKQWTQKIYKQSYKFQNPLHQNYKHVKTLESSLGISGDSIFSVIVFVGDSSFKTKMPDNVTYASGCIDYIQYKTDVLLSNNQVKDIINKIEQGRLKRSLKTNREHVRHVKEIVKAKESIAAYSTKIDDESHMKCSKCDSTEIQIAYGRSYYFKCSDCEGSTPLKGWLKCVSPECKPRIRKAKNDFLKECRNCKSSVLFFQNRATKSGQTTN